MLVIGIDKRSAHHKPLTAVGMYTVLECTVLTGYLAATWRRLHAWQDCLSIASDEQFSPHQLIMAQTS